MKNKKINRIIMGIIIGCLVLVGLVFFISRYTSSEDSLSIVEKKWLTSNANNIMDVNVYNDIPIYGYNGSGISFSFLDYFTNQTAIKFNKISYYSNSDVDYKKISFRVIDGNKKIQDDDILFYQDSFVVLSLDNNSLDSLEGINSIGILKSDSEVVGDYLGSERCVLFDSVNGLIEALRMGNIKYIMISNVMYAREILENKLNIVYHVSDIGKKYVLNVKDDTLYSIISKYYKKYMTKEYIDDYSREFLNIYFNSTKTSDLLRKNYNGKIYKYGYVVNMPYEDYSGNSFVGTISNYLNSFGDVINTDIEVVRFKNIDELKSALVSGDVDFALTNFDWSNINMDYFVTMAFSDLDYVVLSDKNINLSSIKGLKDYKVSVVGSSRLHSLCLDNNINVRVFLDTNDLIRNINNDDVVLMDSATYKYYQNSRLMNYKVVYENKIDDGYRFILNKNSETFGGLLNYYVSSRDYRDIRYDYNTDIMIKEDNNNLKIVIGIISLIIVVIVGGVIINNKRSNSLGLNKEDMLKYIDPMTSLKNRNYLNHNIYKWDDNVIFPQSVVVIDVNKIKQINDKYGREVGDEVIKKVASILVNNQLENTDIVRSGGDEFLIYMIGYEKNSVLEYTKKLSKEMKYIPNSYGVEVGYSMILDEVKSVDDAINEAILMMEKNKDRNNDKEKDK